MKRKCNFWWNWFKSGDGHDVMDAIHDDRLPN